MDDLEKQERHNQEVAARESGRNDSGTQAGSHGVSQHETNQPHHQSNAGCFPGYTPILTPKGWTNISQLDKGDKVMSFDKYGQIICKEILQVKKHKPRRIVTVRTNGSNFEATVSHSIMTSRGWLTVGKLKVGDVISQVDQSQRIQSCVVTALEDNEKVEAVFNLIVSGNYTFVVKGCLAHSFTYFRGVRVLVSRIVNFIVKNKCRTNAGSESVLSPIN